MIQIIGLRHNLDISIREKLSILNKQIEGALDSINKFSKGSVILSTCNRTEIYFDSDVIGERAVDKVFEELNWDKSLKEYTFFREEERAVHHLMEVTCGFHSKILGEDQILSQVKTAFEISKKNKSISKALHRLFQLAITCGKEFRWKSGMYRIPISSSSIVAKESYKRNVSKYMLIGYGEVGKLVEKYLTNDRLEKLYIVVRNKEIYKSQDSRIEYISFHEKVQNYNNVQCIISCTSSPHIIVKKDELPHKKFLVFDMAIPRDVEEEVKELQKVEVIDIDRISLMDNENKQKRKEIMEQNREILDKYIHEYRDYELIMDIVPYIKDMKNLSESVSQRRFNTFKNKKYTKNPDELAKTMIKSTSDFYINRAIEVLKEEQLKGSGEECLNIIEKIFFPQK
ncbi:glutamyl-tRNA reductase [Clostridium sediminicola]|uniref:glutamyl-tRNA reductase n=1 Tax=Clostridium sediminicola TaxID=3114879 RepID=UPI0031F25A99